MNKASFLQRAIAWLIDQAIISIMYLLITFAFAFVIGLSDGKIPVPGTAMTFGTSLFSLVLLLGQFLYFGYFWSTRGRTIGMGVMNIKVVKTDGSPLSFLMAGARGTAGYYLSGLVFGLGYLWFFIDAQKETWHDKVFKTDVLKG
jgi:uncharacterized RDD family membrane protein YckC